MLLLTSVAEKEHWSTKQAAFSIAQTDDATTSRDLIESFDSPSDLACSQKCLQNDKCRFKIYHVETKKCELLASIYQDDFKDDKAMPLKREETLTKDSGACGSGLGIQNEKDSCQCANVSRSGELKYICNCTKQATAEENPAISGQEDFAPVEEKKEATKENNENKESTEDEPLKQSSEDDLDKFESENNDANEDKDEKDPEEESKDGELKQEDPTGLHPFDNFSTK
eukprot:gene11112-12282_t